MNEQTEQTINEPLTIDPQPDLEALRSENESLRAQIRLRAARDELTRLLAAENARSPELLFEASASRLVFDDVGALSNMTELIDELKARFPEQFSVDLPPDTSPPAAGGMRTGSGAVATPIPSINSGAGRLSGRSLLTREMLAKMKPRDIARLDWNEVKQVVEQ